MNINLLIGMSLLTPWDSRLLIIKAVHMQRPPKSAVSRLGRAHLLNHAGQSLADASPTAHTGTHSPTKTHIFT